MLFNVHISSHVHQEIKSLGPVSAFIDPNGVAVMCTYTYTYKSNTSLKDAYNKHTQTTHRHAHTFHLTQHNQ